MTKPEVLGDLAAEQGFDRAAFLTALADEGLKAARPGATTPSRSAPAATGFPTVVVGPNADGTYALVTRGYNNAEAIFPGVDHWLAGVRPAEA